MAIKDSEGAEANRAVHLEMQAGACGARGQMAGPWRRQKSWGHDCGIRGSCPSEQLWENTAIPSGYALSISPWVRPRGHTRPELHEAWAGDETEARRAGGSVAALQDREQTKHSQQDRVLTHSRGSCYTPRERERKPSLGRKGTHSSNIHPPWVYFQNLLHTEFSHNRMLILVYGFKDYFISNHDHPIYVFFKAKHNISRRYKSPWSRA